MNYLIIILPIFWSTSIAVVQSDIPPPPESLQEMIDQANLYIDTTDVYGKYHGYFTIPITESFITEAKEAQKSYSLSGQRHGLYMFIHITSGHILKYIDSLEMPKVRDPHNNKIQKPADVVLRWHITFIRDSHRVTFFWMPGDWRTGGAVEEWYYDSIRFDLIKGYPVKLIKPIKDFFTMESVQP